jgi:hypothetical protein
MSLIKIIQQCYTFQYNTNSQIQLIVLHNIIYLCIYGFGEYHISQDHRHRYLIDNLVTVLYFFTSQVL